MIFTIVYDTKNRCAVPSIVVDNNGSGGGMERQRPAKSRLSKQDEFEEADEDVMTKIVAAKVPSLDSAGANGTGSGDRKSRDKGDTMIKSLSADGSPTGNKDRNDNSSSLSKQRSHPKVKLLQRSHALRDDTSPPPETENVSANTLSVTTATALTTQSKTSSGKHRLGKQGSSQGSMEGSSPALSRDSSLEQYTDSTGTDLQQFIIDTLHKNQKDRMLLLKIEQELIGLVKDSKRQHYRFSQMSAYQRMLVHRVAAFFGLDHNVDQTGQAVIVNKTKNTRIPDMKFREQIKDELIPDEPKKSILKRDSSSFEEGKDSSSSQEGAVDSPLRSHESTHNSSRRSSQEDLRWPSEPRPWSSTDSDSSNHPAKLVITKTSASTESEASLSERLSTGSCSKKVMAKSETLEGPSSDSLVPRRSGMPKASSFGGISVLVRNDSAASAKSASARLTKAESFNTSSTQSSLVTFGNKIEGNEGVCKSISVSLPSSMNGSTTNAALATIAATTPQTTVTVASSATSPISLSAPLLPPVSQNSLANYQVMPTPNVSTMQQCQPVMWAVSNMESVPPGSVLINPQTGQPYLNTDGTIYRYNPTNPPAIQSFLANSNMLQHQQQAQQPQSAPPPPPPSLPSQPAPQPLALATPPLTAQAPFILCTPTVQNASLSLGDQQRHYVTDPVGANTLMEISNQLSNLSFAASAHGTAENLAANEGPALQPGTPSNPMTPQGYGMPLSAVPTARPTSLLVPQQSSVSQPMRYMNPFSFVGATTSQNFMQPNQQAPILETPPQPPSQQQQMHESTPMPGVMQSTQPSTSHPQTPNPQTHPPQGFQMLGAQCVQSYPLVGYGHAPSHESYNVSPYFSMASQSHQPITSSTMTIPAFAYTVTSLNPPGGGVGGNGGTQALNPSQANYLSSTVPLCGFMPSVSGGGGGGSGVSAAAAAAVAAGVPPLLHPPAYHQTQGTFRPQTPPGQVQGNPGLGMAAGQHQPSVAPGRSFALATPGMVPNPCPNYSLYSSQSVNQPSVPQVPVVQHQSQQCVPVVPTSQTPQFNAYTHHVLASLPMFRPNMHMMVRSTTPPPPQSIISTGNGQYTATPLLAKGYGIPLVDQRFVKTSDLYLLDTAGNIGDSKGLLAASLTTLPNGSTGIRPPSVPLYSRVPPIVQGDLRLIGTPLQHQMQPPVRLPMMLSQQRPLPRLHSPLQGGNPGIGRPKMRRQRSKGGATTCSGVGKAEGHVLTPQLSSEAERGGHILEIQGFPDGLCKSDAERYLKEVVHHGAKLQFVRNHWSTPEPAPTDFQITNKVHIYAVFESEMAAQSALLNIKTTKYQLRPPTSKQFMDLQGVS